MASSPKRASFYADLDRLRTVFQTVDTRGKGYIGERELARLTRSVPGLEESMTAELMEKLDRDKDGMVSFADFEALFELERDTRRRLPQTPMRENSIRGSLFKSPPSHISDSVSQESQSLEFSTALESLPLEVSASPTGVDPGEEEPPAVRLRHKRIQSRKTSDPLGLGLTRQTQSSDMPDLATQIRSLTTPEPFESPGQLHRRSKVLSWISESEDWPEDLAALSGDEGGAPSPLLSPRQGSDEASHAKAVLESVCNTDEIGRDAIMRLCNHVKADPQEQQELLLLLEQLDRERHGSVSLDKFVHGLQAVRNAAIVTSTPSPRTQLSLRRRRHSQPLPKLSESFSTPISSKPTGVQLASIPLATPGKEISGFDPVLAVLDPDNSGYVSMDSIVSQFQMMGLDSPHNQSIEEALHEAVPVDPAGRMSVTDLTASLESALVGEGTTHSVLRRAGLQSYKMEISMLRTQMHQAHMEKDKIKSKLNSTLEENRRLAREGDEHADSVTREHQRKVRELDARHTERLKETERILREEAQQLREKAVGRISGLEEQINKLKIEDEKLRADLKYAEEEAHDVTDRLSKVHAELNQKDRMIAVLQKELTQLHSDQDSGKDVESQLSRLNELQREVSERTVQMQELQESNRELQDRVDELAAEREEWKQKYTAQKRKLQRKKSFGSRQQGTPRKHRRHSSKEEKSLKKLTTEARRKSSPMAPLLSLDDETDGAPSFIAEGAIGVEPGAESPTSPSTPIDSSEETPTSASDDLFTRSSASLLDEFSQEETRVSLEKRIEQLRREKSDLEQKCQDLTSQLQALEENEAQRREELEKELEKKRQKQAKIDDLLETLEKQRRRLSLTRLEIEAQLANAEDSIAKQLEEILNMKKLLTTTSEPDIKPDLSKLQTELEQSRSELDMAKGKLNDQQRLSEEAMARLTNQIASLESDNAAQTRARDVELLRLLSDIKSLNERHESERESHEREVNSMKVRLENSESLLKDKETAHCEEMATVQQRLQILESKATKYKNKASSLEMELQETKSALSATEEAFAAAQKDIAVVLPALPVQAAPPPSLHTEEKFASLKLTLGQVQQDHARCLDANQELELQVGTLNEKLTASQSRYNEEIERLQSKVHLVQSELSEKSRVHNTEIAQLKESTQKAMLKKDESYEMQIAKAREECEKQIQSNKQLSELQLELIKQELRACEHRERSLQERLRTTESQCEAAIVEASELRERESSYQQQMAEYETSEEKYKCDIEQFKRDLKRRMEELETAQENEEKRKMEIANLTEELSRAQPRQSVDATDFSLPLESIPHSSLPVSPSRLSYRSDQSLHDELISQMKSQLEDLQGVLISQGMGGTDGGEEELSLVQELLLTIQNGTQREKQSKDEGGDVSRVLEFPIPKVVAASPTRSEPRSSERTLASVVSTMVTKLSALVDALQKQCEEPLSDYRQRIEKLTSLVSTLANSLHEQDQQHKSKVSSLVTELDNARTALDSYRLDVDLLKSGLAISQEDLNRSRGEMERLQKTKDSEVQSLKTRLRRAESLKREREEKALQAGSLEAAVITHSDLEAREREITLRDKLLVGKDVEISDLRAELNQIKSLMISIKKAQSRAEIEAEDQLKQKEKELDSKNQKICELETMLKTYSESFSLEPRSENTAVAGELMNMSKEVAVMAVESTQEPREGEPIQEEQHSPQEDSATEHEQQLQALRQKVYENYDDELSVAKLALEQQTMDLREIYCLLVGSAGEEHPLDHSLLVQETRKEVERLQSQFLESQQLAQELEETLQQHQEEHDQMDSQFQAEHEEEVRALRQQKQQLFRQNEELKLHYQQLLSDQDKQNATLLQDLFNSRSQMEVQMRDARLEKLKAEKQVADLTLEKKVLMDIIKQLVVEAGTTIDIT